MFYQFHQVLCHVLPIHLFVCFYLVFS
jgi:hypothetical protein